MKKPASLLGRFLRHAERDPDRSAVHSGGTVVTYGRLRDTALRRAALLRARGVRPGDRVALLLPPGPDAISGMLAAMACGAAFNHLDPDDPPARIAELLASARPRLIVDDSGAIGDVVFDPEDRAAPPPKDAPRVCPSGDRIAYVVHTSGTTGTPKAVQVTHANVTLLLDGFDLMAPPPEALVTTWWTSPRFDVSILEVWSALTAGGAVAIVPPARRYDAALFLGFATDVRASSCFVPVAFLPELVDTLESNPRSLVDLRRLLVGVEPIPLGLATRIARARAQLTVVNGYGPAETTISPLMYRVDPDNRDDPSRRTPIGRPIAGVATVLLDPDSGLPTEADHGELMITGGSVSAGYVSGPDSRFGRYRAEPSYRTGDLVTRDPNGDLVFKGRVDRQLKIRGYRLEPEEVEHVLAELADVEQAAVIAVDDEGGPVLAAYVVPRAGATIDETAVRAALASRLPSYAVPRHLVALDELPQTASAKLDHAALRAALPGRTTQARPFVPDDPPAVLATAWQDLFGDRADLSFVALGGTSLDAIRLSARLRAAGAIVTVPEVLAAPGLTELTARLRPDAGRASPDPATACPPAPGQLGITLHESMAGRPGMYIELVRARLPEDVDTDRLLRAARTVTGRHPALRTAVRLDRSGRPELVADAAGPEVGLRTDVSIDAHEAALAARLGTAGEPLASLAVVLPGDRTRWLSLGLHHTVTDDTSMSILLDDLAAAYAGEARPQPTGSFPDLARRLANVDQAPGAAEAARRLVDGLGNGLTGHPLDRAGDGPAGADAARFDVDETTAGPMLARWRTAGVTPGAGLACVMASAIRDVWGVATPMIGLARERRQLPADFSVVGCAVDIALVAVSPANDDILTTAAHVTRSLASWLEPGAPSFHRFLAAVRERHAIPPAVPQFCLNIGRSLRLRLGRDVIVCEVSPPPAAKYPLMLMVEQDGNRLAGTLVTDRAWIAPASADRFVKSFVTRLTEGVSEDRS